MPAKKSSTPVQSSTKTATKAKAGTAAPEVPKKTSVTAKMPAKPAAKSPARKTAADELDVVDASAESKKKAGRPAKAASADKPAAKRGRKPKAAAKEGADLDDADLSDIEDDLTGEVEA